MSAGEALTAALLNATDRDQTVPCAGKADWTAEDHHARERAAEDCAACPAAVHTACAAYADQTEPVHGVWAGLDWTRASGKARPTKTRRTA